MRALHSTSIYNLMSRLFGLSSECCRDGGVCPPSIRRFTSCSSCYRNSPLLDTLAEELTHFLLAPGAPRMCPECMLLHVTISSSCPCLVLAAHAYYINIHVNRWLASRSTSCPLRPPTRVVKFLLLRHKFSRKSGHVHI